MVDLSLRPLSSVRLTSPSLDRQWRLLNEIYNVVALQLNLTPVITCYRPFIVYL